MIIKSDSKPRKDEVSAWSVAIGNLPKIFSKKATKETALEVLNYAKNRPGFLGVHPEPPKGTLILYNSMDSAVHAREAMLSRGIIVGNNICEVFIPSNCVERSGSAND